MSGSTSLLSSHCDNVVVAQKPQHQDDDDEHEWSPARKSRQQLVSHEEVLDVMHRGQISPLAFKAGVPPKRASRIHTLYVVMDEDLPAWMDVLSNSFFRLQHLYLSAKPQDPHSEPARMRRLYILYRLPDLVSIDGHNVQEHERRIARPNNPNGHRVNRLDWVGPDGESFSDDGLNYAESNNNMHGDAVEVNLWGEIKRVDTELPQAEEQEPCPRIPHARLANVPETQQNGMSLTPNKGQEPLTRKRIESFDQLTQQEEEKTNALVNLRTFACVRSTKYLAAKESEITVVIDNPHRFGQDHAPLEPARPVALPKQQRICPGKMAVQRVVRQTLPPSPTRNVRQRPPSLSSPFPRSSPKPEPLSSLSPATMDKPTLVARTRFSKDGRPPPSPASRRNSTPEPGKRRKRRQQRHWRKSLPTTMSSMLDDDNSDDEESSNDDDDDDECKAVLVRV